MSGGTEFWFKPLLNGEGIAYNPRSYTFYYLNNKQAQKLLANHRCKIIKPKFLNPFWLCFFDLSYKCNLNCVHCHNQYKMDELTFEQKIDVIRQIHELGVLHISFSGGEPTLYPKLIDILKYASKNATCSFVTNGCFINEKLVKQLKGLVTYVGVSLDGFRETHAKMRGADIFDKAINAIKLLKKYGIQVRVTSTPTKINYKELPDLGKFIINELGETWKLMVYMPEGNRRDDLCLSEKEERWLYKKIRNLGKEKVDYYFNIPCPAGKSVFSIYANGDVSPCGFLPQLVSGNVRERPLIEILREGTFFKLLRIVKLKKCLSRSYWRGEKGFSLKIPMQ